MESMDKDLCEMFFSVMQEHLTDFMRVENIRRVKKTLPAIRRKFKGDKLKRESNVRSFPTAKHCGEKSNMEDVAYFYEYSTCLASSTATNFSEVMDENMEFFRQKVHRKTVNICCIAGGVASEMVAVVKTLCEGMKDHMQEFLHFQLALINADDKWNVVISSVLRELRADVKAKHKVKLTPCIVEAKNHHDVLEVVRSSDVLVSTKYSADMSDMKEKPFQQLLEVALKHMKSDSLFFFIDTSAAVLINFLEKNISKFGNFQPVYKRDCNYHSLSLDSVEHHLKRYNEYFGVDLSSSYCFFSAYAWLKVEKGKGSRQKDTPAPIVCRRRVRKDKKTARKNAYWFRRSVDILCSHADA